MSYNRRGGYDMNDAVRQKKERGIWDRIAACYDARMLRQFASAYERAPEKVLASVSQKQTLLDIGCGTGLITLRIAPHVEHITAIDLSPQMLAVARRKVEQQGITNVDFQVADGYSLPLDGRSFDAVLLFNILHIVQNPGSLLQEAHRLLKPNGCVFSATDCYAEPVPWAIRMVLNAQKLMKLTGSVPFMRYYKKEDLDRLFERSSFLVEDSDVLQAVPVNYYVRARKV
ncbi:MAG: class I SAM-dependent methyltransferase, partial [Chloroflexi bacterium]